MPPLLIAHLVKFLGHIFHLDKLDCIVECRCIVSQIYNSEMLAIIKYTCLSLTGMAVRGGDYRGDGGTRSPPTFFGGQHFGFAPDPHHSEEIAATAEMSRSTGSVVQVISVKGKAHAIGSFEYSPQRVLMALGQVAEAH